VLRVWSFWQSIIGWKRGSSPRIGRRLWRGVWNARTGYLRDGHSTCQEG
jgi:hypothetical protein